MMNENLEEYWRSGIYPHYMRRPAPRRIYSPRHPWASTLEARLIMGELFPARGEPEPPRRGPVARVSRFLARILRRT